MEFHKRVKVNLSSSKTPNLKGHITWYKLRSGNYQKVYYVEDRFYASKEVCGKTGAILDERSSSNDYHYSIDIFFEDKSRYYSDNSSNKGTYYSD